MIPMSVIIHFASPELYHRPGHPTRAHYRLVVHAYMDATRIEVVVVQRTDDSICLVIPRQEFVEKFAPVKEPQR